MQRQTNPKNELLELLGGMAMLIAGLFLFSKKVVVSTTFFTTVSIGGFHANSGLVVVPFIIGIILVFVKPQSFGAKVVLGLGVLLIVVSVIASTTIRLYSITLYEWLLYLVLIFGGLALTLKILLAEPPRRDKDKQGDK